MQHPHHAKVTPKFCKQYAQVGKVIQKAMTEFKNEVRNGEFPGTEFTPYKLRSRDRKIFIEMLGKAGFLDAVHRMKAYK